MRLFDRITAFLLLCFSGTVLVCLLAGDTPWVSIVAYWSVVVTRNAVAWRRE